MAASLGEKLRNARESRGISIREIADQTRISARYLEAIEEDSYKSLPGGVFNKGFVKSYAKYVGIDEKEALEDYTRLMANQGHTFEDDQTPISRRPEVHVNDSGGSSQWLTILGAILILGLLTAGIIYGLQWYQERNSQIAANAPKNSNSANANTNSSNANNTANSNANTAAPLPPGALSVKVKVKEKDAYFQTFVDGKKVDAVQLPAEAPAKEYAPEQSFSIRYPKDQGPNISVTVNGKELTLPTANPPGVKGINVQAEITKETAAQILQSGQIPAMGATPPAAPPSPAAR